MAYYRNIHIGTEVWRYHIGRQYVVIRGPKGERINTTQGALLGVSPDELERAEWKQAWRPPVTPGLIRERILTQQEGLD